MNIKKLASFSFGPILGALFGFLTLPLLAWYFSPADIGRFSMLQVTLSLGVMFFSLALHQSYVREYNEISDKGNLLALSFWPGVIFLFLIILIIEILKIEISELIFGLSSRHLDFAIYAGLFLSLIVNSLSHTLRMQERGVAFSLTQIIPRISLLLFVLIIINISNDYSFKDIVFSNVLALLLSSLLLIHLVKTDVRLSIQALKNLNWRLLKAMLKFALPLIIGGIAYWVLTTIDRIFIQKYAGFDSLGIYAVAMSIASGAAVLTSIFSTIWHPTLYKWTKDGIEVKSVQNVIDYVFIVVALIWSLVGVVSGSFSFLLPPAYSEVQYLLVACFSVPLLYLLSETTMVGIGISRKSNYAMLASIVALIVSVTFNYLLVPIFAERGAATASMFAFSIFFLTRTEATCFLWKPIKRKKIYFLLSVYIGCSVASTLTQSTHNMVPIWIILFATTTFLYRERIETAIQYLRKRNATNI